MTEVAHHAAADGIDEFIPVCKGDIIEALVKEGALANDAERDKFRRLCQILASDLSL